LNMTPVERKNFMVGVPFEGTYIKILDSALPEFGGMGSGVPEKIKAVKGLCDYKDYSIAMDLPPYAAEVFVFQTKKKTVK
ncbi:MAG: alpha amylase C-terminal domain-containing protein, partial [Butyrivibrio sp.]|nr:alpha amylase C-terminal domain-containing protein [Butyrivibrio sp.]